MPLSDIHHQVPLSLCQVIESTRHRLLKSWIALSTGWITIQRISIRKAKSAIHRIKIYSVDNVIPLLRKQIDLYLFNRVLSHYIYCVIYYVFGLTYSETKCEKTVIIRLVRLLTSLKKDHVFNTAGCLQELLVICFSSSTKIRNSVPNILLKLYLTDGFSGYLFWLLQNYYKPRKAR